MQHWQSRDWWRLRWWWCGNIQEKDGLIWISCDALPGERRRRRYTYSATQHKCRAYQSGRMCCRPRRRRLKRETGGRKVIVVGERWNWLVSRTARNGGTEKKFDSLISKETHEWERMYYEGKNASQDIYIGAGSWCWWSGITSRHHRRMFK